MAKLVVITGATGKQGGSVVNAFLRDSSFKIRAIARDLSSAPAKVLAARGVDVVHGDINDEESLVKAFKVFLLHISWFLHPLTLLIGRQLYLCHDWRHVISP